MSDTDAAVLDIVRIEKLLYKYMQAVDAKDAATLKAEIFVADAVIEVMDEMSVDAFCNLITDIGGAMQTQHFLTNSVIDVDGDAATARTYFIGYQRVPAGPLGDFDALFEEKDSENISIIGGVATDRLVRQAGKWLISRRKIKSVWRHAGGAVDLLASDWLD